MLNYTYLTLVRSLLVWPMPSLARVIILGISLPCSSLEDNAGAADTAVPDESFRPRCHPSLVLDESVVSEAEHCVLDAQQIGRCTQNVQSRLNLSHHLGILVSLHERPGKHALVQIYLRLAIVISRRLSCGEPLIVLGSGQLHSLLPRLVRGEVGKVRLSSRFREAIVHEVLVGIRLQRRVAMPRGHRARVFQTRPFVNVGLDNFQRLSERLDIGIEFDLRIVLIGEFLGNRRGVASPLVNNV